MSRRMGFIGALVAAALVIGASEAAAAGRGETPGAIAQGCGAQTAVAVRGGPARSASSGANAATNWSVHPVVDSIGDAGMALVAVGARSAVSLATSSGRILVLGTTDAGATWASLAGLGHANVFEADGDGSSVDVLLERSRPDRLLYVRSGDGGRTWSQPIRFDRGFISSFAVARAGNTVAVAWWNQARNLVARVSINGGASFGAASRLASAEPSGGCAGGGPPPVWVAVSGHQILVRYFDGSGHTVLRRGLHDGAHWTSPYAFPTRGDIALVAHGHDVLVIASSKTELLSHDHGRTWQVLPSPVGKAYDVRLAWGDGAWQLAYHGSSATVLYRQSADASHWSPAELVATESGLSDGRLEEFNVAGVAATGTPIVLLSRLTADSSGKTMSLEAATRSE